MSPKRNPRGEMPFLDHLEELRWRIIWSAIAIAIGTGIGFYLVFRFEVLELLVVPVREALNQSDLRLQYLSPADPFFVSFRLAIYVGLILAFPIIAYQIWAFLSPALEKREKRAVVPALYLGVLLFAAGMALAYWAALPATLQFFNAIQPAALEQNLEINRTLGFVVKMLIAFGAVFELPIVILVLSVMGLVTPAFLRAKRRHAIVAITILASFITPGDIIVLTIMMMIPLVFLYELGIFLSVLVHRAKNRPDEDREPDPTPPPGAVQAQ